MYTSSNYLKQVAISTLFLFYAFFSFQAYSQEESSSRDFQKEFVYNWLDTSTYFIIFNSADSIARKNPDKAVRLYRILAEKSNKNGSTKWLIKSSFELGKILYSKGEYISAAQELKTALNYQEKSKTDPKELLKTLNLLGSIYNILEQPDKAIPYYQSILDIRYDQNNTYEVGRTLITLGILNRKVDQFTKSIELLKVAKDIFVSSNSVLEVATVHDNLGLAYLANNDLENANKELNSAKKIRVDNGDVRGLYNTLTHLVELQKKLGDIEEERSLLEKTENLSIRLGDRYANSSTKLQLADLFFREGNLKAAERQYLSVLYTANKDGWQELELAAVTGLYTIFKRSGNTAKALEYLERLTAVSNEINLKKSTSQIYHLEYLLDKQKAETVYESERRDSEYKRQEQEQANVIRNFIISLSLFGLLFVFSFLIFKSNLRSAKRRLFESNDRYKAIENTPFIGIIIHDNGKIVDCNQEFLRMVKQPKELVLKKNIMEFLFKDRTFKTGKSQFKVKADSNEALDVMIFEREITFDGKKMKIASLSDVSKVKEVEKELMEAKLSGEKLSNSKSQFLANMSHEIRTPLNGIIAGLDLLKREALSAEGQELVNIIKNSADNLFTLINDILDLNKVEAGKLDLQSKPFKLGSLIKETNELMQVKAQQKGIKLGIKLKGDVSSHIYGDQLRLKQILTNLLSNAVKFTSEGSVDLEVEAQEKENRLVNIRFSIQDTGVGIKKEDQRKIFETFTQGDLTSSKKYGGSGLGLSITKKLVEMMGGKLDFRSNYGQGSVFFFDIDLRKVPQKVEESLETSSRESNNNGSESDTKEFKILLAEDNKMNQKLVQIFCNRSNIPVTLAENGQEALDTFKSGEFDLVLMDVQMPIMDGLEATKSIRTWERRNNRDKAPIIALTANAMKGDKEKCIEAGMNDFIPKPFKKEELEKMIFQYINEKKALVN